MKRSCIGALSVWAMAAAIGAQASETATASGGSVLAAAASTAHATFTKYCVECHGSTKPKAGLDIAGLVQRMSDTAVAERADTWVGIARMLETEQMPPDDADRFPHERGAPNDRGQPAGGCSLSTTDFNCASNGGKASCTVSQRMSRLMSKYA